MLRSLNRRRRRKAYWMFRSLNFKAHAPDEHRSAGERESRGVLRKFHVWCRMFIRFRARQIFCVCTISQFIGNLFHNIENCFLFAYTACHSTSPANIRTRSVFRPEASDDELLIQISVTFPDHCNTFTLGRNWSLLVSGPTLTSPDGLKLMFAPLGMEKQFRYQIAFK